MSPAHELELRGVPVRLEAGDDDLAATLARLYAASFARAVGSAPAADELSASIARVGDGHRIAVEGRDERIEPDATAGVRALHHELLQALMVRRRELYFVHAAVVTWRGRALVLPGLSRAGKSTLALALVLAGAGFLSDELLAFTPENRAEPLPRALKLRDECVHAFPELAHAFTGSGEGRSVPFEALRADVVAAPAALGAVAVPRWDPAATDRPEPITRGEALLALAASSLNFGAHRAGSLDRLADLVGDAATFALAWNDPRAAARNLLAELD
jgi:hypothetical protein